MPTVKPAAAAAAAKQVAAFTARFDPAHLYFYYGASLTDPHRFLQGNGHQGRFIRLDDVARLGDRRVVSLIRAAIKAGDTPLPRTGRGYVVVKSISARQRPRRPART